MFQNFKLPQYREIAERNRPFIEQQQYKGYQLQVPVVQNLYISIDCQNEHFINPAFENVIRFSWCNKGGFAISSARFINTEAGYLMGCAHLIQSANELATFFDQFVKDNVVSVRKAVQKYETEHPEEFANPEVSDNLDENEKE